MIVTTKELYSKCYGKYAIAAVNVEFMEQVLALFSAGSRCNAPFIVQTTPAARHYAGADMITSMVSAASRMYPKAIFALHLDHGDVDETPKALQENVYHSVMIDGSHLPFEENILITRKITKLAHTKGVQVEGELGVLGGVEDGITPEEEKVQYTNPEDVLTFVEQTEVDSLAIAVGTSHGAYKLSSGQGIQFHILEEIQNQLPQFPLVLHGCSNVNPVMVQRINAAGGQLHPDARGISIEEMQNSIQYGICKINIATDFRLLWTQINREFFRDEPQQFAPLLPGRKYMEAYQEVMIKKFDQLGAIGQGVNHSKVTTHG